jgi:hypothetical protein
LQRLKGGWCSVDLGGEPVPRIGKTQKLFPVLGRFHLLGEGSALVGMEAVL